MERVIREYGIFLLEGMIGVLLIMLFFTGMKDEHGNIGFFNMVGANLQVEKTDCGNYKDFRETFYVESEKTAPVIEYIGKNLKVGVNRISENIAASNYAGNSLSVDMISIKNPFGEELIDRYNEDTLQIHLELPGIYTMVIGARDDGNRYSEVTIRFPVNKAL